MINSKGACVKAVLALLPTMKNECYLFLAIGIFWKVMKPETTVDIVTIAPGSKIPEAHIWLLKQLQAPHSYRRPFFHHVSVTFAKPMQLSLRLVEESPSDILLMKVPLTTKFLCIGQAGRSWHIKNIPLGTG